MRLLKWVGVLFVFCTLLCWGVIDASEKLGVIGAALLGGVIITSIVYKAMVIQVKSVADRKVE